ncbi:MAG: cytochrome c [Pseudomonadota bacterium]
MPRAILCAAALALSALPASAETVDVANGGALFQAHCAACHGAGALGDGPMTEILSIVPADLTQLTDPEGFPAGEIARAIDGRDMIAHGGPMPVFGQILEDQSAVLDARDGTPVFTSQAVVEIVRWLETVQQ